MATQEQILLFAPGGPLGRLIAEFYSRACNRLLYLRAMRPYLERDVCVYLCQHVITEPFTYLP